MVIKKRKKRKKKNTIDFASHSLLSCSYLFFEKLSLLIVSRQLAQDKEIHALIHIYSSIRYRVLFYVQCIHGGF